MGEFWRLNHRSLTGPMARHRSYALLLFLALGVGIALASITWSAWSSNHCGTPDTPGVNCEGSYSLHAAVAGPRPSQPAIITSPKTQQHFDSNPVQVEGTCPSGALIKIFTNGILVGSIFCQNGRFGLPVDLVIGKNDLTALPFNELDEQGPTSPTVTVFLDVPPGGIGFSTQLLLQSESYYRGTEPGVEIAWPITIIGGKAPYAVSIDWGDGTQDVVTRLTAGPFTLKHTYERAGGYLGSYPLIIRAADSVGQTAYLQLVTIVNDPNGSQTTGASSQPLNKLLVIWPIWIVLVLMIISFWLGERREKHIMEKRMAALA